MKGLCDIKGDVYGEITFAQERPSDMTFITGHLLNLPRGNHGIHIHEFGDTSNGCTSAGEHFNPFDLDHGGPESEIRHLGDLGNVYSRGDRYVTVISKRDGLISLYGPYSVLGRSVVVHAMEDDLGRGDNKESKISGNSGGRLGCGVIGVKCEKIVPINDNNLVISSNVDQKRSVSRGARRYQL
ncbi:Superoxide Dismutase [Epinotia aporema granulovirus]|uniref:superoxide dismutase n=1 Tax=Epinotia aporema granulovirus TaxID=166056 RepID=K4ER61_9BBAC|nr:Superoxide Dismutase [Epinotia aporema granulovirus]AER41484.1 Superoxide Dismutase [Epinotia aporema granulovirus]